MSKMVFVKLKRACCFFGKDYQPGVHEFPEGILDVPFFKNLLNGGKAEVVSGEKTPQKTLDYADVPPAPAKVAKAVEAGAPEEEMEEAEILEEKETSKKHSKNHNHKK